MTSQRDIILKNQKNIKAASGRAHNLLRCDAKRTLLMRMKYEFLCYYLDFRELAYRHTDKDEGSYGLVKKLSQRQLQLHINTKM